MTRRRDWLRSVVGGGAAAFAGTWGVGSSAQEPSATGAGARRTVRRPVVPNPERNALRPVLEPWESRPPIDAQAQALLEAIRARHKLPGLVGAIAKGPAVVSIAATGVRKVGEDDPIRVGDQIHVGSCTKAMTATLVGTLFEEGLLGASSTLAQVFPEYADRLHPDFREATLSHLLTHRAGLPHDAAWWDLPGRNPTEKRYAALVDMCSVAPKTRPGRTYAYSNVGYVLAGLMAEHVTGATWEDLMRARVFEPLYMYSAGFGPPGGDDSSRDVQPYGHEIVRGRLRAVRHDNPEVMGPAGTVHCSIVDWAKFAVAHLRGEREGAKLLLPATYRDLHTPPPGSDYAGGWLVFDRPWAGGRALNHAGSNTMWYANVWLAPARDFAVLVATNQGGGTTAKAADEAVGALLGRYEAAFAGV
ncbi:serine hydrolase domain-containing protein [Paludisphaera mucosa]|uniref:Serine hydrolase n=1 Tax=Paludisphaera mucosa TaxID=3030827 RepID=A0ABT6F4Q8_9BACT|nr:serine hydrolase domain-containing protein [Paludisphaera mucosa]MDG3002504.1 serine hydrolase [Paludisphaera mucosa]